MADKDTSSVLLDKNTTYISLGVAALVLSAAIGAAGWISSALSTVSVDVQQQGLANALRFQAIEHQLVRLEAALGDRWTSRDMRAWVSLLVSRNPELKVPLVDEAR